MHIILENSILFYFVSSNEIKNYWENVCIKMKQDFKIFFKLWYCSIQVIINITKQNVECKQKIKNKRVNV